MKENMDEIRRQTYRYYYQDGLVELAVGGLFAVIGFDLWLISASLRGSTLSIIAWILLPILTTGGVLAVQRLLPRLKEKWVYPRTGYVDYKDEPRASRWLVIGAALAIGAASLLLPYDWLDQMSVFGGVILGIALAVIGTRVHLPRLKLVAAFALAAGIGLAFVPGNEYFGLTLTFVAVGLALAFSGGWTFRSYLKRHRREEV